MDETKHDENTPRDVVREYVVAFMTLDTDRMEACTSGEDLDRAHTRAFLDMMAANRAFMVKFIATYGVIFYLACLNAEGKTFLGLLVEYHKI